ncbi:hypothetical protein NXS08_04465 [Gleimia sp. 6138-11-ORH1]|uniref:hypothetical protein n=1 Tax=Gleimia sp. 6138-11-ORH1 TaxID=2973937 RepID=UPI002168C690|nr:hypothetical protein [Gleimia sp. 6138-11-ORH1]MCS4484732.1 hypothetical protein [Gleimia sp. 6138-11-ORH1]
MKENNLSVETGSASISQLATIALLLIVATTVVFSGFMGQQKQVLQVKADAVALGAAQILKEYYGREEALVLACEEAALLADLNGVKLLDCVAEDTEVWVFIREVIYDFNVISRSRAGISANFEIK